MNYQQELVLFETMLKLNERRNRYFNKQLQPNKLNFSLLSVILLLCMYSWALCTSPCSVQYSISPLMKGSRDIVSESPIIARCLRARVTATFVRRCSLRKPNSPQERERESVGGSLQWLVLNTFLVRASKRNDDSFFLSPLEPINSMHFNFTGRNSISLQFLSY